MGRSDFHLLSDDEIRNALDVGACKLVDKLWPKLLEQAPDLKDRWADFFDRCKLELAKKHGVAELLEEQPIDSRG